MTSKQLHRTAMSSSSNYLVWYPKSVFVYTDLMIIYVSRSVQLERVSPSTMLVDMKSEDKTGIEFTGFRRLTKFDLTGTVNGTAEQLDTLEVRWPWLNRCLIRHMAGQCVLSSSHPHAGGAAVRSVLHRGAQDVVYLAPYAFLRVLRYPSRELHRASEVISFTAQLQVHAA